MPGAAAFVVKRVWLRVNTEHAFINFDQCRWLVSRERHAPPDKLQLFGFLQHRYRRSLFVCERVRVGAYEKSRPARSAPLTPPSPKGRGSHPVLTPFRKTSMTTSAIGSSL